MSILDDNIIDNTKIRSIVDNMFMKSPDDINFGTGNISNILYFMKRIEIPDYIINSFQLNYKQINFYISQNANKYYDDMDKPVFSYNIQVNIVNINNVNNLKGCGLYFNKAGTLKQCKKIIFKLSQLIKLEFPRNIIFDIAYYYKDSKLNLPLTQYFDKDYIQIYATTNMVKNYIKRNLNLDWNKLGIINK